MKTLNKGCIFLRIIPSPHTLRERGMLLEELGGKYWEIWLKNGILFTPKQIL